MEGRWGPRCRELRTFLARASVKLLAASGARECLCRCGCACEGLQQDQEGLVANGTFVLLLAAVGQLVILVVPWQETKNKRGG